VNDNVLVTGGAGFVGSSLVRRLLDQDYSVTVIDNLLRGSRGNLPTDDRLTFVEGDIRSGSDLAAAIAFKPNYVVHLAAQHFIPYCNEHPGDTIHVNVYGTQNILDAIADSNCVDKLIFASTAAVYAPSDKPHTEDEVMAPIDIYGISKKIGEELVDFFHRQTGISALNARLFNVVGPRETNPHLIPDIFDQLPTTESLKLGNLVPKRDYTFTDDIADGIIAMLRSDVNSGSINIGSGNSYSAGELVEIIGEIMNSDLTVDSIPERQRSGDRPNLCANNARLRQLGWSCQHDLRSTLTETLEAYSLI